MNLYKYLGDGRVRSYQLINIIIAGVIVLIIIYSGIFSPLENRYPVKCVHEQFTGEPCPSCGLSHSFSYIVRGDLVRANDWNVYGIRVFLFFLFQLFLRGSNFIYLNYNPLNIRYVARVDISLSVITFILGFSQFISYNLRLIL